MRKAAGYVHTSADDCRISLQHCNSGDLPILREALALCEIYHKKTHIKHLASRIKQLEKAA